jgi:putative peptidoglycan lipid II flippase
VFILLSPRAIDLRSVSLAGLNMKQKVFLGIISATNIGITILMQWLILTGLGAGEASDALFAGMTIPQITLTIISGAMMHVLVPILAAYDGPDLKKHSWTFMTVIGVAFCIITTALYVSAQEWIPITVPGFNPAATKLTVELTRIQLFGVVFSAVNGVQWATYHARQEFLWAEIAATLAGAVCLGLLIWVLPTYGPTGAAWLLTLRFALLTLLLMLGLGRPPTLELSRSLMRTTWARLKPILLGNIYYKTDPLIDRYMLSYSTDGALSIYYAAQQIYSAANQIINKAISAPFVSQTARLLHQNNYKEFRKLYRDTVTQIAILCTFGSIGFILLGVWALNLLMGYGNMQHEDLVSLWWIMLWLLGVFVGGAIGQIFSSAFYAVGDTATVAKISAITYTIYVPVKIGAYLIFGVPGIAICTSIWYIADCLIIGSAFYKTHIQKMNILIAAGE